MNGVEFKNLTALAEHETTAHDDWVAIQRILSWRFGLLTDADIAVVSLIRAKAARPNMDRGPEPDRAA